MLLIFSSWQVPLEIQLATLQMLHNRQAYSLADVSICDKVSRNIRRKASAVEEGSTLYPNELDPRMARDTDGFQLLRLDEQVLHRLLLGGRVIHSKPVSRARIRSHHAGVHRSTFVSNQRADRRTCKR